MKLYTIRKFPAIIMVTGIITPKSVYVCMIMQLNHQTFQKKELHSLPPNSLDQFQPLIIYIIIMGVAPPCV